MDIELQKSDREKIWKQLEGLFEETLIDGDQPIERILSPHAAKSLLAPFDFSSSREPLDVFDFVVQGIKGGRVDSRSPRYFGLFTPDTTTMGVVADAIVASLNPQLASWNHASFAVGLEEHLIRNVGKKIGFASDCEGSFTTGGAEANHTAILVALNEAFPNIAQQGLCALKSAPIVYVTSETHHSVRKAARLCGLGVVTEIPLNSQRVMCPEKLSKQIKADRAEGKHPLMVFATFGSTTAGMIDPIEQIADVCKKFELWLHIDAAWGGAAAIVPEFASARNIFSLGDSLTLDAHKWLFVPLGAGMYFTRHTGALERTFGVSTSYMPRRGPDEGADPYTHSMQWSRRFIGLKLFMNLAVMGWARYEALIREHIRLGQLLRSELEKAEWHVVNNTPLPVVCFHRPGLSLKNFQQTVVDQERFWISVSSFGGEPVLRACTTSFKTTEEHVYGLVDALNRTLVGRMKMGA